MVYLKHEYIVEIHHSGRELSILSTHICRYVSKYCVIIIIMAIIIIITTIIFIFIIFIIIISISSITIIYS